MKVSNPEANTCDYGDCDGVMFQEGKPEEIKKSYTVKPGEHYIRYMNLQEETEMLYMKMSINQKFVPDETKYRGATGEELEKAKAEYEQNLYEAAEYHSKENIKNGQRGIAIDMVPPTQTN